MKLILMSILVFGLMSCSVKKKETEGESEAAIELTDSDELIESSDEELALTDEGSEDSLEEASESEEVATESSEEMTTEEAPMVEGDSVMNESSEKEIVIDQVAETKTYTVEKGDTLMMIAFKIYGDYGKWREIANLNSDKLINGQIAPVGTALSYYAPSEEFSWNPEGNPYLVRTGDTLGGISTNTYGTMKFWKSIWDNNRPLIKNPNKIYAGFTIYTPVIEGREVATK